QENLALSILIIKSVGVSMIEETGKIRDYIMSETSNQEVKRQLTNLAKSQPNYHKSAKKQLQWYNGKWIYWYHDKDGSTHAITQDKLG
ncbi:unnamed protein product, partial [marine sediment metagenome]